MSELTPPGQLKIGPGCEVLMHFTIALEDGTEVETTYADNEPLRFVCGDGTLGAGLEAAIFGLQAGESQSLQIEPGIAFGEVDASNIHDLPMSDFRDRGLDIKPGAVVDFDLPNGDTLVGTVLEINAEEVSVDFNHPLAARTILFSVEILSVERVAAPD